jgi:hypothetical protein
MALTEIDRIIAAGVRFGCVLADAGYGLSAPFRQGLTARNLTWAVGIPRHLKVYPADVQIIWPVPSAVEKNSASIISGTSQTFYRYRPKTMQALPGSALEVSTRAAGLLEEVSRPDFIGPMPNFALMCMAFTSTVHYALPHHCST